MYKFKFKCKEFKLALFQLARIDKKEKEIKWSLGTKNLEACEKVVERDSGVFEDELEIILSFVRTILTHSPS